MKFKKFAKISSRKIIKNLNRENKFPRKQVLAKISSRKSKYLLGRKINSWPQPPPPYSLNCPKVYDLTMLRYPSFRIVYLSHLVQEPPKMLIQSPKVGSLIANHIVIWGPPIGLRDCLQHVFLLREIVKTLFLCMNLWNGIHAWCVLACKRKRKKTKKKIL